MESKKKLSPGRLHRRYREAWHLNYDKGFWDGLFEAVIMGTTLQTFCAFKDIRAKVVEGWMVEHPRLYERYVEAQRLAARDRRKRDLTAIREYQKKGVELVLEHV